MSDKITHTKQEIKSKWQQKRNIEKARIKKTMSRNCSDICKKTCKRSNCHFDKMQKKAFFLTKFEGLVGSRKNAKNGTKTMKLLNNLKLARSFICRTNQKCPTKCPKMSDEKKPTISKAFGDVSDKWENKKNVGQNVGRKKTNNIKSFWRRVRQKGVNMHFLYIYSIV